MDISILIGKTLTDIIGKADDDELIFVTTEGTRYKMFHNQDCCESVTIEDITGDLQDLIGSPITLAEARTNDPRIDALLGMVPNESPESYTWTFYEVATAKGHVSIRWYGTSNGYYSESVDFVEED